MTLNQGQIARIKAERLNEILASHSLEAISHHWGTQTYHLTRGLCRKEGIEFYLKGKFFSVIDIGRGVKLNNNLTYNFTSSPYIVWEGQTPRITDEKAFFKDINEQFVRSANCGFLPGEKVGDVNFTSPIAGELARKMFPHLVDDPKTPCSQWEGKHHLAFMQLFPATYVGCRKITQNNYKLILHNEKYGEFEVPSSIVL